MRVLRSRKRSVTPAVSIVVPVFGTEAFLSECLRSLARQSFGDIEVIVVDDCSPGDVAGTLRRSVGDDPRFHLVRHGTNQGVFQARITGVGVARGTYVGFVDSDDLVDDRFVEWMHASATAHDADFVQCALQVVWEDGSTEIVNRGGDEHVLRGADVVHGLLAGEMSNSMCNKLIRATVWRAAVGGTDPTWAAIRFAEDLLCSYFIAGASSCFVHIPQVGYRYVRRSGSTTMSVGTAGVVSQLLDLGRVFDAIHSNLLTRDEPPELVRAFFDREFKIVVREMFRQFGPGDHAAGLPASPPLLGLLGAVFADGLGTAH